MVTVTQSNEGENLWKTQRKLFLLIELVCLVINGQQMQLISFVIYALLAKIPGV